MTWAISLFTVNYVYIVSVVSNNQNPVQSSMLEVITFEMSTYGCYVAQQHDKQSCKQQHNRFLK